MAVIGLFADAHYNRQIRYGNRHCPDSWAKLEVALAAFRAAKTDFIINLGDSIDCHGLTGIDRESLADLQQLLATASCPIYPVMGNHDLEWLSKADFRQVFAVPSAYPLSFDHAECHTILLDAAFSQDGRDTCGPDWDWQESWLPQEELDWLKADLLASGKPLNLVCIHQNLDARSIDGQADPHCVRNARAVRRVLQQSKRRIVVLQGHYHPGLHQRQQGIHYLTLRALCEGQGLCNNAFAILRTTADGDVEISGQGRQDSCLLGLTGRASPA